MVQWIQDKWKRVRVNRGLNHKGSVKIGIVQLQAGKRSYYHGLWNTRAYNKCIYNNIEAILYL